MSVGHLIPVVGLAAGAASIGIYGAWQLISMSRARPAPAAETVDMPSEADIKAALARMHNLPVREPGAIVRDALPARG